MKRASTLEICVLLVAALAPCSAIGEIYKCVQDGKTLYQDQPCRLPAEMTSLKYKRVDSLNCP